jgi:hypothetical protein
MAGDDFANPPMVHAPRPIFNPVMQLKMHNFNQGRQFQNFATPH